MTRGQLAKNKAPGDPSLLLAGTQDFLMFRVEREHYATPLSTVREIVERFTIKRVPFAPAHYLGIMNLRGRIVSILDLKRKFMMKAEAKKGGQEPPGFIMMLDLADTAIGLLVDEVIGVRRIEENSISLAHAVDTYIDPNFIIGSSRIESKLVSLVDLAKYIEREELASIRAKMEPKGRL